jgi:sulfur carrier protein ThiS
VVVRVRYVFGLARGHDGRDEIRLELPGGTTVFEAMQRLGVSALELHAAVNGESAPDGTVLRDGDEVTLIPAIQGGRGESSMRVVTLAFAAALAAGAAADAAAQNRVIVPIVVPRPAAAPAPGVPASPGPRQVTIQGAPRPAGASAGGANARGGASVPSFSRDVRITSPGAPTTRVTVESVSPTGAGVLRRSPVQGGGSVPSFGNETKVTVRQNSGPGTPEVTTDQLRIFSDGPVEIPLIILE